MIICDGGASGDFVWVGDVGRDPPNVEGLCGLPPPGGSADDRHGTITSTGRDMVI